MEEQFTVTTHQYNGTQSSTYRARVTLDLENQTFCEHSTLTFADGVKVESSYRFEKGTLYLDDQPIESTTINWLNNSAHLIVAVVALKEGISLRGDTKVNLNGSIEDLNRACEGQLNLDQLGLDSTYDLTRETDRTLTLKVTDARGKTRMIQVLEAA